MRETDQAVEAENAGAAFDRVDGPEHGVDGVVRPGAVANIGEARFDLLQRFAALIEEGQFQLLQTGHDLCFRVSKLEFREQPC